MDPDYPKDREGPPGWLFESHVAEDVMRAMLKESNVTLILNGGGIAGVQRTASQIKSIALTGSGTQAAFNVSGDVFIDARCAPRSRHHCTATDVWPDRELKRKLR